MSFIQNLSSFSFQKIDSELKSMLLKQTRDPKVAKGFANQAMKEFADQFGLSPEAAQKLEWSRAQFEVNYQVLTSVNKANGEKTVEESFSFKASYEFLAKASGVESNETQRPEGTDGETTPTDALSSLQEYFSPEKTAERILDVALSFFRESDPGKAEGVESAEARKKFSDFIGAAIEEGFNQARSILGTLPDEVSKGVDRTHSLVFAGLEDFVKNGIDQTKIKEGGVFEKIAAYRAESAALTVKVKQSIGITGYNAKGEAQELIPEESIITTKS